MLPNIEIDSRYIVTDSGTSDGTQIKYFYENKWYKIDRYGGEGAAEELASKILELSDMPANQFVKYDQISINGKSGCVSKNFLKENESFITLYRLYSNLRGSDLATVTSRMDYDEAIDYVLEFIRDATSLDLKEYLANIFTLDALILNEDRHFNNLGLIYDGKTFRPAPIFDNGKSLFIGNKSFDPSRSMKENKKDAFAKGFSGSFSLNLSHLKKYASLHINYDKLASYLNTKDLDTDNVYSRLNKLMKLI